MEFKTAQEEAVKELNIVTVRHHLLEHKAQIEALFVAQLHRKLREQSTIAQTDLLAHL